ncbi:AMP-binding enzyme [Mesorhizobium sp. Root1471]|uniref:AMP-binding enzyme n=1 Tax=Mesorhizobium sp. Root1471 TaxID=1736469 RepID=UPI0039B783A7
MKIRGFRINLNEVEEALSRHPAVEQIAVVDLEDESRQRFLKAFVVPAAGAALAYGDLKRHCLDKLPKYMVPEQLELCASLPKTSTGKIDRRQLRQAATSAGS